MFGLSKTKSCSDHVYSQIQPILSQAQNTLGLPKGFWEDPYIIGFFSFFISFHTNVTSSVQLNEVQKGELVSAVFARLSNRPGEPMARRFIHLSSTKDEDFELGQEHASALCFASIGKGTPESAPFIENIKAEIKRDGFAPSIGKIFSVLFCDFFLSEIVKRFEIDSADPDVWDTLERIRVGAISGRDL